jgi:hypothetical protein
MVMDTLISWKNWTLGNVFKNVICYFNFSKTKGVPSLVSRSCALSFFCTCLQVRVCKVEMAKVVGCLSYLSQLEGLMQ